MPYDGTTTVRLSTILHFRIVSFWQPSNGAAALRLSSAYPHSIAVVPVVLALLSDRLRLSIVTKSTPLSRKIPSTVVVVPTGAVSVLPLPNILSLLAEVVDALRMVLPN